MTVTLQWISLKNNHTASFWLELEVKGTLGNKENQVFSQKC
jgi:hypothetical protein